MKALHLMLLMVVMAASLASAAPQVSTADKVKKGNELFLEGGIDAAQQAYADAQVDAPDAPEILLNLGDTFYRQGKHDKAIELYTKVPGLADRALEAKAHYNIGNAQVQQGKLKEALESYKRSLALERNDEDAKYNLEYVTRKIKELASKQKDDQEKDPLQKLLRDLEKLINLQAATLVETRDAVEIASGSNAPDMSASVTGMRTNQEAHAVLSSTIQTGFKDLLTNIPPERLNSTGQGQTPGQGTPPGQPDTRTQELGSMFQAMATIGQQLSQPQTGAVVSATDKAIESVSAFVSDMEQSSTDDLNKQFAVQAKTTLDTIRDARAKAPAMQGDAMGKAGEQFNSLMQAMQGELKLRIERLQAGGTGTNAPQKTIGQKIENAIGFMGNATTNLAGAASDLVTVAGMSWTNAVPFQEKGLDNLILARKEFDDSNQQQQQQQQNQQNQQENKDQKDKKDQQGNNDDKDKKDQQQNQNQQQQQQQQQKDKDKQQQQKPQQMDKDQAARILQDFDEDQRKKEKARKEQMQGTGYERVDKDW